MLSRSFVFCVAIGFCAIVCTAYSAGTASEDPGQTSEHRGFRTWTDRTGNFKTDAAFIDFKDGAVRLKKGDGSIVNVPIDKLCVLDQEWVKNRIAAPPKTHEGPKGGGGCGVFLEIAGDWGDGDIALERKLFDTLKKVGCQMAATKEHATILVKVRWTVNYDRTKVYRQKEDMFFSFPNPFSASAAISLFLQQDGIRKLVFEDAVAATSPRQIAFKTSSLVPELETPSIYDVSEATAREWENEYDRHRIADRLTAAVRGAIEHPEDLAKTVRDILEKANSLIDANPNEARKFLKELVDKFPDADAAKEARTLLDGLALRDLVRQARGIMQTDPYRASALFNDAMAKYPSTRFTQEAKEVFLRDLIKHARGMMQSDPHGANALLNDALATYPSTRFTQQVKDLFDECQRRIAEFEKTAQYQFEKVKPLAKAESLTARNQLRGILEKYPKTRAAAEAEKLWRTSQESASQAAAKKLAIARMHTQTSRKDLARTRLEEIVHNYPDTPAGKEAEEVLKQLVP